MAKLPGPIHLVAQTPHPHVVGLDVPLAMRWSDRLVPERMFAYSSTSRASCTPRVPRLTAYIISLSTFFSQIANSSMPTGSSRWSARRDRAGGGGLGRPDAVLPAVTRDEVAAGIADRRDAEFPDELDDVAAEAVLVGGGMTGLVDAVVDAPPQMLDE